MLEVVVYRSQILAFATHNLCHSDRKNELKIVLFECCFHGRFESFVRIFSKAISTSTLPIRVPLDVSQAGPCIF